MKITDLRCAVIGNNPVVRILTDEGIDGLGQAEDSKPYLKPHVLFYKKYLIGEDPTDVERCMLKIRRLGSFKPWGAAVSAIEFALWDIAGKAAGRRAGLQAARRQGARPSTSLQNWHLFPHGWQGTGALRQSSQRGPG
jgi:L-alanine-DL-glutamate epimerase-like enolase superfamily enzyme